MGVKQTKIEGSYLSDTPTLQRVSIQPEDSMHNNCLSVQTDLNGTPETDGDPLDPRSPSGCRTPISILNKHSIRMQQQQTTTATSLDNPLNMLRKRFFRGFTYNLHDPRSPSMQLNRTPLLFDELNDKTLNLDDTFSDLFVDSRAPNLESDTEKLSEYVEAADEAMQVDTTTELAETNSEPEQNEDVSIEVNSFISAVGDEEETMPCPAKLLYTPLVLQQQLDPRSPTIGVDRTPIIFNDDEANEDAMLENILATLSLNLSSSSSVASFNAATTSVHKTSNSEQLTVRVADSTKPLANKHLERVRRNNVRHHQRLPHKQPKSSLHRSQRIFEDRENTTLSPAKGTPKKRFNNDDFDSARKRTPLSCVKNRTHLRSRSVESSGKSQIARLPLSSFDDNLGSMPNAKFENIRILQGFEDSLEL